MYSLSLCIFCSWRGDLDAARVARCKIAANKGSIWKCLKLMFVGQEWVCKNPWLLLLSNNFCGFGGEGVVVVCFPPPPPPPHFCLVVRDWDLPCNKKVQWPKTYQKGASSVVHLHGNVACVTPWLHLEKVVPGKVKRLDQDCIGNWWECGFLVGICKLSVMCLSQCNENLRNVLSNPSK